MDEQTAQRKYMQLQLFKEQLEGMVKQKQLVDEKAEELMNTVHSLTAFKSVDKESEAWSPMGSGVFVESEIKDTKEVAIAIGAGVVIKKNIGDAIKTVTKRLKEIQEVDEEITGKLQNTINNINSLQEELKDFIEEQEKIQESAESMAAQNVAASEKAQKEDPSVKPDYGVGG